MQYYRITCLVYFENKLDFMSLRLNFLISLYKVEKKSKFPEG